MCLGRICQYPNCITNIELAHPTRKYCDAHQIIKRKERYHLLYIKKRGPIPFHPCLYCGKETTRPKFCRRLCGVRYNWYTKYKFKNQKSLARKCIVCKKVFRRIKNQKYCSVYCYAQSLTAYWRHRREQKKLIRVVAR